MKRTPAIVLAGLLAAPAAWAQDSAPAESVERVVIWLDRDLPSEAAQLKAHRKVGGEALHVGGAQLAWPPTPYSRKDSEYIGKMSKTQRAGQERWEQFEVELGIARDLEVAIEPIEVLRDAADRDALIQSLLWQAAAVNLAFKPEDFAAAPEASAFRVDLGGGLVVNRPLLDAYALDPTRIYTKGELPEADSFAKLEALAGALQSMPKATLVTGALPGGATLYVDGTPREVVDGELALPPGHHYVHLLVAGTISGRTEITLQPNARLDLPFLVSDRERGEAERKVEVEGSKQDLGGDVEEAIARISAEYPGAAIYVAAVTTDARVEVVPWSGWVEPTAKPITFAFAAELGGAAVSSPFFYYANPEGRVEGDPITTPAANGALDLELGIYNFAILGGAEIYITPLEELVYGSGEAGATEADNYYTVVHTKLTGGLGAYILRPKPSRTPTLLIGANYGWFSPGHTGPGARLSVGIPMDRGNWFRLSVHGFYGQPMEGYPEVPLISGGLRLGFQSAL
ncbi:MAG: hypothetical protein H6741_05590 [Alphaproteobacteria bacterium]|nr:hypothetical protein [Alphaproteobacteria bacterium]